MARHSKKKHPTRHSLSNQAIITHHSPLIPVKGRNWKAILAGFLGLALILVLFVHVEKALDTLEAGLKPVHHTDHPRIEAINQQMESLHGQFSVLLAESVEMKLKALSKDMEKGKLNPEDARLFDELEKELQMLEQYSADLAPDQLENNRLEHPRFKPVAMSENSKSDQEIPAQFTELRSIVYFSLSALGITLLAFLGYWAKQSHKLPNPHDSGIIAGHLPKLPDE